MAFTSKVKEENVGVSFVVLSHPFTMSKYIQSFADPGDRQQSGRKTATFLIKDLTIANVPQIWSNNWFGNFQARTTRMLLYIFLKYLKHLIKVPSKRNNCRQKQLVESSESKQKQQNRNCPLCFRRCPSFSQFLMAKSRVEVTFTNRQGWREPWFFFTSNKKVVIR